MSVVSVVCTLMQVLLFGMVAFVLFVSVVNVLCGASYRRATTPSRDEPIELVRRNYHFGLENTKLDDVAAWNGHGRFVSLFLAALSLFFPAGERMFVRAVQHHQVHPDIQRDEKLKVACAAFVSQESVHGREHDYYNNQLKAQMPIAHKLERIVEIVTGGVTRFFPHRSSLGATCALEHWTAIMAGFLLTHPLGPDGGVFGTDAARSSRFGLIWQWHACEETEHKAVAFDVHERCYGSGWRGYVGRCSAQMLASAIFWVLVPLFTIALVASDGQLFNFAGWWSLLRLLFYTPGMFWRILPAFCDFFRFSFHPWDHNNVEQIKQVHELERKLKAFQEQDDQAAEAAPNGKATAVPKVAPADIQQAGAEVAASASS